MSHCFTRVYKQHNETNVCNTIYIYLYYWYWYMQICICVNVNDFCRWVMFDLSVKRVFLFLYRFYLKVTMKWKVDVSLHHPLTIILFLCHLFPTRVYIPIFGLLNTLKHIFISHHFFSTNVNHFSYAKSFFVCYECKRQLFLSEFYLLLLKIVTCLLVAH